MEKELKELRLAELKKEYAEMVEEARQLVEDAQEGHYPDGVSDQLTSLDEQMADNLDEQKALTPPPELRFMYNGIKYDGKLYKGSYSKGSYHKSSGIPEGSITIYAKDYERFPRIAGLEYHNETDSQTDYFDTDKIRVYPDHDLYEKVHTAYEKQQAHREKVIARRSK